MVDRLATCGDGGGATGRLRLGESGRVACCGGGPIADCCSLFPNSHNAVNPASLLAGFDANRITGSVSFSGGAGLSMPPPFPQAEYVRGDSIQIDRAPRALGCNGSEWAGSQFFRELEMEEFGEFRVRREFSASFSSVSLVQFTADAVSPACAGLVPSRQYMALLVGFVISSGVRIFDTIVDINEGVENTGSGVGVAVSAVVVGIYQPSGSIATLLENPGDPDLFGRCLSSSRTSYAHYISSNIQTRPATSTQNTNESGDVRTLTTIPPVVVGTASNTLSAGGGPNSISGSVEGQGESQMGALQAFEVQARASATLSYGFTLPPELVIECDSVVVVPPVIDTGRPGDGGGGDIGTPVGPGDGEAPRPGDGDGSGGGGPGGGGPGGGLGGIPETLGPDPIDCETSSCADIRDEADRLYGSPDFAFLVCPDRTDCFGGGGPVFSTLDGDGDGNPSESPNSSPPPPSMPDGIPDHLRDENRFGCRGCGDG